MHEAVRQTARHVHLQSIQTPNALSQAIANFGTAVLVGILNPDACVVHPGVTLVFGVMLNGMANVGTITNV